MNFILRMLLGSAMGTGFGDQYSQHRTGDLGALTEALKKAREEKDTPAPLDRLTDAFTQLKDMHKDPAMEQALLSRTPPPASPFDVPLPQARPFGASMAQAPQATPMPMVRPAEASQAPEPMGFFQRNTALMRDPLTGDFIDPHAAQVAQSNPFKGMFG